MKIRVRNIAISALMIAGISGFAQEQRGDKRKANAEEMVKVLGLSEDQVNKVKMIFEEEKDLMKTERLPKEEMDKLSHDDKRIAIAKHKLQKAEAAKATIAKLNEVLTKEQMAKYAAIKKQKMAKGKEFREERREPRPEQRDMH